MVRRFSVAVALGATLMTSGCGVVAVAGMAGHAPAQVTSSASVRQASGATGLDAAELDRRVSAALRGKHTVHVVFRASGLSASGDVAEGSQISGHLTVATAGTSVEVILIGGRAWLRSPRLAAGRWVAARSGGTDPISRSMQPAFDQIAALAPGRPVHRQLAGPVTKGRKARLADGTVLTEYVAHPSVQDVLDTMPKQQANELRTREITGVAVHLWVDARFVPRRMTSTLTVSGHPVQVSYELSRWGAPVRIVAPAGAVTLTRGAGA